MTELPVGWTEARLEDICCLISDGTHHSPPNKPVGDYLYITAKNIRPWGIDLSNVTYVSADIHRAIYARCPVEKGDILYIKDGATTGIAINNPLEEPFSLLSSVALLKPNRLAVDEEFLRHWLNSPETFAQMTERMTGSAIRRLTLATISKQKLPVPPVAEQRRIVAKVDSLFAKTKRARDELGHIPRLVERYKQAILAAAFRGDLTTDWRAANGVSLDRTEQRKLGDLVEEIRYGTAKKCTYEVTGRPVLRIPNIENGRISHGDLKYADFDSSEVAKFSLRPGDLLLIRSNGSVDLVGRAAIVGSTEADFLYAGYLIRLRPDLTSVDPRYLLYAISEPTIRSEIVALAKSTSGVHNINSKQIAGLLITVRPLEEQREIVRRIDAAYEWIDKLAREHERAMALINRLDRSILSKAFRGELVPRDPNDEPAAVLLDRIRAERAKAVPKKRTGRKARVVADNPPI